MKLFDAHFHIIDPRFPLVPNRGFTPDPFTCDDYRERTKHLGIFGGAVVSGSFQAFDQSYLADALEKLGASFAGVTQIPASVADSKILELDRMGVRAVRFNLKRGGSAVLEDLESLAGRVHALAGWHVELYTDSRDLGDLYGRIVRLPRVCIDHMGLAKAGYSDLLRLVERGAYVKLSGFGRLDFDPRKAIRDLAKANPDGLIFGTDLPSTRAKRPFLDDDVRLVCEVLEPSAAEKAFCANAMSLYSLKTPSP